MHTLIIYFLIFGTPLLLAIALYLVLQKKKTSTAKVKWQEAQTSGLTEPASLHPVIDPAKCLGCGSCVSACPEGEILGLVNRKAKLVTPSACIGHGACREACPVDAITLVFGTETRGVEIPLLNENFETNVHGIYIAGELGGMGLIRNAITQGLQAVNAIAKSLEPASQNNKPQKYDLIIVGAGPAGLSAALAAKQKKIRYLLLEQDSIGGTLAHYPRGKIAMTRPAVLPLVGKFEFHEASKEGLIKFWNDVVVKTQLAINSGERVEEIDTLEKGFLVKTPVASYTTAKVLLALGRRGTPRKLNVPGEELSKVVYRLVEPEQYAQKHVLVVGGGDSALEAALAVCDQPGSNTSLSYRSDAFSRAKQKNRERVLVAEKAGKLRVLLQSSVLKISVDEVTLKVKDSTIDLKNDQVIVCAGGILPTPFLRKIGIHIEEKFGQS